jgi:hypothetical protein
MITLSSTIQGYVTIQNIPPGIYHQPRITITVKNYATGVIVAQQEGFGPQVFPTTNVSYTYSLVFDALDGVDYDINENNAVFCSFSGTNFIARVFDFQLGAGYTLVKNLSSASGYNCTTDPILHVTVCDFLVTPSCTNNPQYAPPVVTAGPPALVGWYVKYVCERANSSQPWSCAAIPYTATKTTDTGPVLCPFYPISP